MAEKRSDSWMRLIPVACLWLILSACEEGDSRQGGIEPVIRDQAAAIESPGANDRDGPENRQPESVTSSPEPGSFVIQLADGRVSLKSVDANRLDILEELARKVGFEFEYDAGLEAPVDIELEQAGIADVLETLLDDKRYRVEYSAEPRDNGFRIARLQVGAALTQGRGSDPFEDARPTFDLAAVFPDPGGEIYLGSDAESENLAARLQSAGVEDQIEAIGELTIDPVGMRAAYQIFSQTTVPRVRIAVLELIEGEEDYLSRSMIVMSLQSQDPAEAMYALQIVDSQEDFSLAARVSALQSHHDAEVRQLAAEVLESITSEYAEEDDAGAGQVTIESTGSRATSDESGAKR